MDPDRIATVITAEASLPLWDRAADIWIAGGWAMVALAIVAFAIFGIGTDLFLLLRAKGFKHLDEKEWKSWIDRPDRRRGRVGRILDVVTAGRTPEEVSGLFEALRLVEITPIRRRLRVMKTCVAAAPLLGLLGTVTGMLATFEALSTESSGAQTMLAISAGISEALITTQTGLVIVLPGLFFQHHLGITCDRYRAFLDRLECVCRQDACRRPRLKRAA